MSEQTTTMTPPPAPARPPLRRSSDRVLAGVAGGVARWLGVDPTIVRVVLVVLAIFGGSGLILYAAGWLLIPADDEPASTAQQLLDRAGRPGSANRVLLIVLGACFAVLALAWIGSPLAWHGPWDILGGGTLLLLLTGGLVVWLLVRDGRPTTVAPPATPLAPTNPSATTPDPVTAPSATATVPTPDPTTAPITAAVAQQPAGPAEDTLVAPTGFAYGGSGGYPGYTPVPAPPPAPRPPRPRSYLGLATLSVAVLVLGTLTALNVADVTRVPAVVVLASTLGVLGLGLLVSAFAGRATWLIAIALPLLLVTALVAVVPSNAIGFRNVTIGDAWWTPTTAQQVVAPHRHGIGDATLDLRGLTAATAPSEPVTASLGIGALRVLVPDDLTVDVDASAGVGTIEVAGVPSVTGTSRTLHATVPATGSGPVGTVDLELEVGIGTVEVTRG